MTLGRAPLGGLDTRTQLDGLEVPELRASGWRAVVYPTAGEAVIVWVAGGRPCRLLQQRDLVRVRADAARRATNRLRRYTVANQLAWHVVLTFRSTPTERLVAMELRNWRRRVREAGGAPFPYVLVVERGNRDGRLHVHTLLPEAWLDAATGLWVAGITRSDPLSNDEDRRNLAGYLAKDFAASTTGTHRYEVGQGFQPEKAVFEVESRSSGLVVVHEASGGAELTRRELDVAGPSLLLVRWPVNDLRAA
jgi:hypothetical protein